MKTEIEKFNPCKEAIIFRNKYPDFQSAWNNCHRGDWMLWLAKKLNVDDRKLTLAKGLCAQTIIHLMKDDRSKIAVEKAIAYGKGEINRDELNAYAYAAAAAAAAAAYADAAAAYADAVAAAAAYAAAADADAVAADAVAAAADDDTVTAAKIKNRKQTADICKEILTDEILKLI